MASLGHPCKFQRFSRLGSVTARHSSSGRQPNFAALNRGRHLYSAGQPSRWALAHILVLKVFVTTGITTRGYGLLVGFVARSVVRLSGLVVKVPAACKVNLFESRVCYFVSLLDFTVKLTTQCLIYVPI